MITQVSIEANVVSIASSQGWVVLREQVLALGMSDAMIQYRLNSGLWARCGKGAYAVAPIRTLDDRLRAAQTTLPGATISHESAGYIHSVPYLKPGLAVVTVDSGTTHEFEDVVVHRTRDLSDADIVQQDGLRLTTLPRTVVDLGGKLKQARLEWIVDDLLASEKLRLEDLVDTFERIARRGKRGIAVMRRVLDERVDDPLATSTDLERRGVRALVNAGLPMPRLEYPHPWDYSRRFDAAYLECQGRVLDAPLGIEFDSRRWHTRQADFDRDRERDRLALLNGWRVARFTWRDVTERADEMVEQVTRLIGFDQA